MRLSPVLLRFLPILLFLALAPGLRAQGGPPFVTDDPGTPGDGHWEINTAWIHESRSSGHTDELPLIDLNYGVGDRLQLKYEASELLVREGGEPVRSGFSNSLAGVKWRFYDDAKSGWAVSTYPQLEFRNPGSDSARWGLTADETTLILPVEVVKELGHGLAVNFETGYVSSGRSDSSWFYGVVLGGEMGEKTELGIELHGECSSDGARSELATVLGLRYKVTDHSVILVSAGRELHNHLEPRASLLSYLGWQILR